MEKRRAYDRSDDWCDTDDEDVSNYPSGQDYARQIRSKKIKKLIDNEDLDQLRTIVEDGWDVNELLNLYDQDHKRMALLMYVIDKGMNRLLEFVQFLLKNGAWPYATHTIWIGGTGSVLVKETVLQRACRWSMSTDAAKMLLEAGAKCTTSDDLQNPLVLALQTPRCPPDLIKVLLEHGADTNDHDGQLEHNPLLSVIKNHHRRLDSQVQDGMLIVHHLLEHGRNPNVRHMEDIGGYDKVEWVQQAAIQEAASRGWTKVMEMLLYFGAGYKADPLALRIAAGAGCTEGVKMVLDAGFEYVPSDTLENPLALTLIKSENCSPYFTELLLRLGADMYHTDGIARNYKPLPLLHRLLHHFQEFSDSPGSEKSIFLPEQLDMFFLHGGNINVEDADHRTPLEEVVRDNCHSNSVRWLIRHGEDTAVEFTLFEWHFLDSPFSDTLLLLLQAGMRVPRGVKTVLNYEKAAIYTWMQEDYESNDYDDDEYNEAIRVLCYKAKQDELHRKQQKLKKSTVSKHGTRQMADLQEFSDESLQVYPEQEDGGTEAFHQVSLDQIHRVLEFLSQLQSLQWYCRRCVRESLVSLQPSVVKTLPGPARLKRYILCHQL